MWDMRFDTVPASDSPLPDLVALMNRGFERYLVPIQFSVPAFEAMLRKDGIDLSLSRVLFADGLPTGIALIARRGCVSRLAAMGIAKEARGKGSGSWLMDALIREARARGDCEMVLEVIEQNDPAVHLYRKFGFEPTRRLISLIKRTEGQSGTSDLEEIEPHEMGRLIMQYGLPDLPWQLSGETIALLNPPVRAYKKGPAYAAISDPTAEHVVFWSLLVEPLSRGKGLGVDMLESVIAGHAKKVWHVPAIWPEEFGRIFEQAGFEREELSQWQMRLDLSS
jgi:GNAT superfamily N-acetyltransferase